MPQFFATKHRACLSLSTTAPVVCKKRKERGILDRCHWQQLGYAAARFTISSRKPCSDAVSLQSSTLLVLLQTVPSPEDRNDTNHGVQSIISTVHCNFGICVPCFAATSALSSNPNFHRCPFRPFTHSHQFLSTLPADCTPLKLLISCIGALSRCNATGAQVVPEL
jgi:hypothetical protein